MPDRSEYKPGTPCWIDIGTDVDAAKTFYGGLFGWTAQDAGPVEETGGYGFFLKDGKMVAGYGPQQQPVVFWTTYVAVSDIDETTQRAEKAGGNVILPPMEVMAAGKMAVYQDPTGAFISAWQPGEHKGAQLVNEPGSWSWNELNTRDLERSKSFYSEVFGWDPVTQGEGANSYTEWKLDGESVAGMMEMPPMVPADVPPHWLVYFAVDDADAAVAKIQELGGSVFVPPMDVQPGRLSVVADPQGAAFAVIKLSLAGS
jgi:predicted enzyme related to lactoylglutathione lyase